MIVSYNWLKEYVDFDLEPEALSALLTMLGLEVEGMETVGGGMDEVVVALIEERQPHPNADKLSLCRVNNGKELLSIVCGAQNMKAGDKVALAQVGAVLPGDFKIKRSKIRGEESAGMLCSEKELGLADDSAGIMILPPDYPLGTPLFAAMGLRDTTFEIGLTPNRADCLSVIGIAREIAAKLGKKLRYPEQRISETQPAICAMTSVTVEAADLCPRYTARYIASCHIAPSPQWLVNRLKAVGMRSINNVVDITNYVLMEFGHPLHAFDFDLLHGGRIIVRRAEEGELFKTLDGQERQLKGSDLTIRDGERIVALAGIMGGENSEISGTTSNILLESAYFAPMTIRRTGKRVGLHTESSHRFERGADIHILHRALDRAAALIAELAGGQVAKGIIDVYPQPVHPRKIRVRLDRVNQLLGLTLAAEEIKAIFHHLEFVVNPAEPGIFEVEVPTFRVDIEREVDLIEEVARLHGYDKIPVTMPKARVFSDRPSRQQRLVKTMKDLLVAQGLTEVINYSFVAPASFDKVLLGNQDPRRNALRVLNPLTDDQSVMRTTLLPGLLESAARNASFRQLDQQIFEMRRVYLPKPDLELPAEPLFAAGLLTGSRDPEGWNQGKGRVDFFDVKGVVENIFAAFQITATYAVKELDPFYHPGKACSIYCGTERLGSMGELHPTVQENYGMEQPLYYFELNVEKLALVSRETVTVSTPSKFPDSCRDIAMLVADEMPAADILDFVKGLRINEVEEVLIFDLYKGANIPAGQKSIAARLRYRSAEKTLTDDEVNGLHQRVIDQLVKKLNITTR